jgi:hypothetical protein
LEPFSPKPEIPGLKESEKSEIHAWWPVSFRQWHTSPNGLLSSVPNADKVFRFTFLPKSSEGVGCEIRDGGSVGNVGLRFSLYSNTAGLRFWLVRNDSVKELRYWRQRGMWVSKQNEYTITGRSRSGQHITHRERKGMMWFDVILDQKDVRGGALVNDTQCKEQ